jgi:hypothetical protein
MFKIPALTQNVGISRVPIPHQRRIGAESVAFAPLDDDGVGQSGFRLSLGVDQDRTAAGTVDTSIRVQRSSGISIFGFVFGRFLGGVFQPVERRTTPPHHHLVDVGTPHTPRTAVLGAGNSSRPAPGSLERAPGWNVVSGRQLPHDVQWPVTFLFQFQKHGFIGQLHSSCSKTGFLLHVVTFASQTILNRPH